MIGGSEVSDFYSQKGGLRGFSTYEQQGGDIKDILSRYKMVVMLLIISIIIVLVVYFTELPKIADCSLIFVAGSAFGASLILGYQARK